MPNCDHDDVKAIVDTDLGDTEIDALVVLADQEITDRGITGSASALQQISMFLTAEMVASRMPMAERSIGENRGLRGPEYYRSLAERRIASLNDPPFIAYNESVE
jgi:hypothetical protein